MKQHELIQLIIVIVVIACAFAYASWRIYKALTAKDKTCAGCPLKEACNKNKKKDCKE